MVGSITFGYTLDDVNYFASFTNWVRECVYNVFVSSGRSSPLCRRVEHKKTYNHEKLTPSPVTGCTRAGHGREILGGNVLFGRAATQARRGVRRTELAHILAEYRTGKSERALR